MKVKADECAVPCNVTEFEPSLSYAQLSAINIERLVLTNETTRDKVYMQYLQALESLQRVDPRIAGSNRQLIENMMQQSAELNRVLEAQAKIFNHNSTIVELLSNMENWMFIDDETAWYIRDGLLDFVAMDKEYVEECIPANINCMENRFAGTSFNQMIQCTKYVQPANTTFPVADITHTLDDKEVLQYCVHMAHDGECEESEGSNESGDKEDSNEDGDESVTMSPEQTESACSSSIYENVDKMHDAYVYSTASNNYLLGLKEVYMNTVLTVFNNTNANADDYQEHTHCLQVLDELDDVEILMHSARLMEQILQARDFENLTIAAEQFDALFDAGEPFENATTKIFDILSACWWMEASLHESDLEYSRDKFMLAQSDVSTVLYEFETLFMKIQSIESHFNRNIYPAIEVASQYLDGHITTQEMSVAFHDIELATALEQLLVLSTELKNLKGDIVNTGTSLGVHLSGAFSHLFSIRPPMMSTSNIRSFLTVQYANTSTDQQINAYWNDLGDDMEETVANIIQLMMEVSHTYG